MLTILLIYLKCCIIALIIVAIFVAIRITRYKRREKKHGKIIELDEWENKSFHQN
jgi:hypothetical protein